MTFHVFIRDNLHEMANRFSWEKLEKYFEVSSAENFTQSVLHEGLWYKVYVRAISSKLTNFDGIIHFRITVGFFTKTYIMGTYWKNILL